jgi:hypothetical protein
LGGDSGENQPIHTVLKAGQLESPERFLSLLAIGGFGTALARLSVEQFKPEFLERVRSFIPGDEAYDTQLRLTENGKGQKGTTVEDGLLYYKNRLWIPDSNELRQEIATSEHDSKVGWPFWPRQNVRTYDPTFFFGLS